MCGITGILNIDGAPVAKKTLEAMTQALHHRGPDGSGQYINDSLGFGHRRLSIIDLSSAGDQPMTSQCGRFVLTYNGEIYNFLEIRKELEARGVSFRSQSDTEVLLYAIAEWGMDALAKLNGMFAFALWDNTEKRLFLARDRYGIKPLYFTRQGRSFLFASEIKSFLHHPDWRAKLDLPRLLEYFTFQNLFTDGTLFEDVTLLPPGCFATLSMADSQEVMIRRFWDFSFENGSEGENREYEEELADLLQKAVKRQLISDVEVGAYLSGGMDSGSITAIASGHLDNMKTFTAGFDLTSATGIELSFDERRLAEQMSYHFETEHYEVVLKGGDLERIMPKLVWHLEDPRVGQCYPNAYVSKLAGKFVKVVLSGAGGDELFGGYPWRYYRAASATDFEDFIDKYYIFWQRLIPNRHVKSIFSKIWPEVSHVWTRDIFRDVFLCHYNKLETPEDYVNHSFYFEAKTFLHGLLLVEDKLSMANSLEVRVPFLDNDLVDFAMKAPVSLKLRDLQNNIWLDENLPGKKQTPYHSSDGKMLLRKVMQRYIPEEITGLKKQGFSGPDASWFRGDSIDYVRDRLCHPNAKIYDYLSYAPVSELIDQHMTGHENRRLLIWSLLIFEEWCDQFLGHCPKRCD